MMVVRQSAIIPATNGALMVIDQMMDRQLVGVMQDFFDTFACEDCVSDNFHDLFTVMYL